MLKKRRFIKRLLLFLLCVFILMNVVAYFHAYKFTHFNPDITTKTKNARQLSFGGKLKVLFTGIENPRPVNKTKPEFAFESITLQSNKKIEGWLIPKDSAKGTVAIFHGYSGQKSSMLDKAKIFRELGYSVFLIDFMGAGGSEGNQTTIGYHEAEQVKTVYEFLKGKKENSIILFGTSMGAAAITRAVSEYSLKPSSIIIECPFGTMLQTVKARFANMHVPAFPMAHLLVFWGGFQNDFNAFKHNPEEYAKNLHCKTLLMYGLKDEEVSLEETMNIYNNLRGKKMLKTFELCKHENYLVKYKNEWSETVKFFLDSK